ncbi:MAG: methyltransferase domain-containing protein [Pseudonocardiales bacterium]|nr:methyltransferase domain-containing protein [Pseudonocardiales bacterium]
MTDLMHKAEIQQLVRDAYRALESPRGPGAGYYGADQLADLPSGAVGWALGVGNPMAHAVLPPGSRVLDVGCGAGIDVLLAARRVGPDGHVIGLDLLPEMGARARANAREAGYANVEIVEGEMEAIPLPDDAVDAVISNGVINLSARKMRALFECARVLRPGGHLCLTDVTLDERNLPPEVLLHPAAWSGCAAGAMAEPALLRALGRVGLVDIEIRERHPFGVEDCARFPLFTTELLDVMRATIPVHRQPTIATVVTVTARQPPQDAARTEVVASSPVRNIPAPAPVLTDMENTIREFSAGDRACGDDVGRDLRAWWASVPPGTRTVVTMRDPSTKADVPSLARMLGHNIEDMTETGDTLRVTVRTKGDPT